MTDRRSVMLWAEGGPGEGKPPPGFGPPQALEFFEGVCTCAEVGTYTAT